MDPLSATASIISVLQLCSKVLGYLNDLKDASKERARCTLEAANLYGLLTALRFRLEDATSNMPWYTAVRALTVEHGPLDQFKEALEQLQVNMTGGKLHRAGHALLWRFKKEEIASILGRMERLKLLVEIALQMDHLLSQAIKDDLALCRSEVTTVKNDTGFIRSQVLTLQSGLGSMQHEQDQLLHDKLMAWLSPLNFPAQQSDILGRRQEGTGQWFLDCPEFAQWLQQSKETLFCSGIPGAGKTMIAAIAIDHLLNLMQSDTVGVAYVYCSYKAKGEQSVPSLLAAILRQLAQTRKTIAGPIALLHQQHASSGTKPSVDDISKALQSVAARLSTIYVVVDALDECQNEHGTRRRFWVELRTLQAQCDLRLMVTSRQIPEVTELFTEALKIDVRASDHDVRLYVAGQVHRLPRCIQQDSSLQDLVQNKVAEAVDGMFLLARLHVDSLLDKRTKSKVQLMLNSMRGGFQSLEIAYDNAIERINSQLPEDAALGIRVLSWVTNVRRPLTTTEICCALAVELNTNELDPDNLLDVDDLVSVCAGLVAVDQESNVIRLVHYTTQEYLLGRSEKGWNLGAQVDIASVCLTYLSFDAFKCTCDACYDMIILDQHAFLGYAAQHWGHHAREVQPEVCELACSLLLNDALIACATQAMSTLKNRDLVPLEGRRGLHVTAEFGLCHLLEVLLTRLGDRRTLSINAWDSHDRTPLSLAAEFGHTSVAALLLDNGADIDAKSGEYGTALQAAAYHGHERVVSLLINRGADVNQEGADYGTALQAASYSGHENIVKALLEESALINAEGREYGSALQAASWNGHLEVVKLLLSRGSDIHAQSGRWGSALQMAALGGFEKLVKLLLDEGADVHMQRGVWGNALQSASVGGNERVVKLLIDAGADVNSVCGDKATSLQAASFRGQKQSVELLLEHGANVNARGGEYCTALQAASYVGHEFIARMLLNQGADANAQGGRFGNALQAALTNGTKPPHVEFPDSRRRIVNLLLEEGADINAQGGKFENALETATRHNRWEMVELLLTKGADIHYSGGVHGSFMHGLAASGRTLFLHKVRERFHPDLHRKDFHGRTVLHVAARGGNLNAFNYLLDAGLDPAAKDAAGAGLLQYVASSGSLNLLEAFINRGLSLSSDDGQWSPLHWACRAGNLEVAERLIRHGIRGHYVATNQPRRKWSPSSIATFFANGDMLTGLPDSSRSLLDLSVTYDYENQYGEMEPVKGVDTYHYCDGCIHVSTWSGCRYSNVINPTVALFQVNFHEHWSWKQMYTGKDDPMCICTLHTPCTYRYEY